MENIKNILFNIDSEVYFLNQRLYSFLHKKFMMCVGTYRAFWLFVPLSSMIYFWAHNNNHYYYGSFEFLFYGILVPWMLIVNLTNHLIVENDLHREGKINELNACSITLRPYKFDLRLIIRIVILTAFWLNVLTLVLHPHEFNLYMFLPHTIVFWMYSCMIVVSPPPSTTKTSTLLSEVSSLSKKEI